MGELRKKPCTAVILAAGQGRRMGTKIQKQYLLLAGKTGIILFAGHISEVRTDR